jgi:hypothetical protein
MYIYILVLAKRRATLELYGLAGVLGSNVCLPVVSVGDGYQGVISIEKGLVATRQYKISGLQAVLLYWLLDHLHSCY